MTLLSGGSFARVEKTNHGFILAERRIVGTEVTQMGRGPTCTIFFREFCWGKWNRCIIEYLKGVSISMQCSGVDGPSCGNMTVLCYPRMISILRVIGNYVCQLGTPSRGKTRGKLNWNIVTGSFGNGL